MNRSLVISPAIAIMAFASIAYSNEPQTTPAPATTTPIGFVTVPSTTAEPSVDEQLKQDIKREIEEAKKRADKDVEKLKAPAKKALQPTPATPPPASAATSPAAASSAQTPVAKSPAPAASVPAPIATSPAPAATASTSAPATASSAPASTATTSAPATASTVSATPTEEPLKEQYAEKKAQNYRVVEFDLAKQKALDRTSNSLLTETEGLSEAALTQLTAVLGTLSAAQTQENYLVDNVNLKNGMFEVALARDSYVKSERGDVCMINTRVSIVTSVEAELTPATATTETLNPTEQAESAAQTASTPPIHYTEIKCFSNNVPTLYQQIIR